MINNEFEIKINKIIEYLKANDGYTYKLYNHTCPKLNSEPDSNIVEYAEDIKEYWLKLTNPETLYDEIILDIVTIIYDNIQLFSMNDTKLSRIKKYCDSNFNKKIEHLDYDLLIEFVNDALIDLLTTEYLYDFRNIE